MPHIAIPPDVWTALAALLGAAAAALIAWSKKPAEQPKKADETVTELRAIRELLAEMHRDMAILMDRVPR